MDVVNNGLVSITFVGDGVDCKEFGGHLELELIFGGPQSLKMLVNVFKHLLHTLKPDGLLLAIKELVQINRTDYLFSHLRVHVFRARGKTADGALDLNLFTLDSFNCVEKTHI